MKKRLLTTLFALTLALTAIPANIMPAHATDLPAGVVNYIRQKDPRAQIRFDGVVLFSNSETYMPVIPQDPSLNPDSQQVIATFPEKAAYPDLIQFDNHFFLMRLIQTASGRLTFPKLADYPIQLKEGLLPQDLVLPDNLYIPVELKVILGALPYNPAYKPPKDGLITPPAVTFSQNNSIHQRLSYVFNIEAQKIEGINLATGRTQTEVPLDCVPSSLKLSPDGKLLFAPCLSTNELVVIDTDSHFVKTRIPVGQRPDTVFHVNALQRIVVSNRYSPFLSLINATELVPGEKLPLPGNGGAMSSIPGDTQHRLVVADASKALVYLVNLNTLSVEKTLKAIPNISALQVLPDAAGRLQVWVASRTQGKVAVIDMGSDTIAKTLVVGAKPVEFALQGDKLFVLSAGESRLDVIDWANQALLSPIALTEDGFPSAMVSIPSEHRAYITMAGATNLVTVNLESGQVENNMPVDFRSSLLTITPDPEAESLPAATATNEPPKQPQIQKKELVGPGEELKQASQNEKKSKHKKTAKVKAHPQESTVAGPSEQSTQAAEPAPVAPKVMPALAPAAGSNQVSIKLKRISKEEKERANNLMSPKPSNESASIAPASAKIKSKDARSEGSTEPLPMMDSITK